MNWGHGKHLFSCTLGFQAALWPPRNPCTFPTMAETPGRLGTGWARSGALHWRCIRWKRKWLWSPKTVPSIGRALARVILCLCQACLVTTLVTLPFLEKTPRLGWWLLPTMRKMRRFGGPRMQVAIGTTSARACQHCLCTACWNLTTAIGGWDLTWGFTNGTQNKMNGQTWARVCHWPLWWIWRRTFS